MSGLLYLTSDDFSIQKGVKGNLLCNVIKGFSLILFYSTHCEHCQTLIPIFKRLPGTIGGCQFGIINVSTNKKCIEMSGATVTPITYVPYIILYIDGRPYMKYEGPRDDNAIRTFIVDTSNNIQKKQAFSQGKKDPRETPGEEIPAYSLGKPLSGSGKDMVCYLENATAYVPKQ